MEDLKPVLMLELCQLADVVKVSHTWFTIPLANWYYVKDAVYKYFFVDSAAKLTREIMDLDAFIHHRDQINR